MAPDDESAFPVGHIKGQCAAAQAWDHMATAKGEDVNFVRWFHSPLEQETTFHTSGCVHLYHVILT